MEKCIKRSMGRFMEGSHYFPPLALFYDVHFRPTNPKISMPLAPKCFYFEGKRAPKKTEIFWSKFSKNVQTRHFDLLFYLICLRRKNFGRNRVIIMFWARSENQFG